MSPFELKIQSPEWTLTPDVIYPTLSAAARRDFFTFAMVCARTQSKQETENLPAPVGHGVRTEQNHQRRNSKLDDQSAAPRYGKSLFTSVALPAYVLGLDPGRRVAVISHSLNLALDLASSFRRIVNSSWYHRVFPDLRIVRDANNELVTSRGGGRRAASIFGNMTGFGGDILIFDDPLSGADASSDKKRKKVNELVRSAMSRLNDRREGSTIVAMQRLHANDPCGNLLAAGGVRWRIFSPPAIAETEESFAIDENRIYRRSAGEALDPEHDPRERLEETKAQIGSVLFAAQYQQTPLSAAGYFFKPEWIRRLPIAPQRDPTATVIQVWDTALKTGSESDYAACATVMFQHGHYYVIDVVRARLEFHELVKLANSQALKHQPTRILAGY